MAVGGLAVVAVLVINVAANVNNPSYPTDDGYIAFSYARTLATHGALALTPGATPVEGFSDFLWVVLLAMAHLVGLSIPTASRIFGVAFAVTVVPITYVLTRRMIPGAWRGFPIVAAVVAGFLPGAVFFAVSGLETTLATLLLSFALMDFVRGRAPAADAPLPWIGNVALLGYAMVRPEGVFMWAALTLVRFATFRRPFTVVPLRRIAPWLTAFLVPFGAYLAWQYWYFGSIIPNTVVAKQGTPLGPTLRAALPYLHGFFAPMAVFTVLAIVGALRRKRSSLIVATALLLLVAFALLSAVEDGYPYQRYLLEGAPALLALAATGGWRMTDWLRSRRTALAVAGTVVLVALTIFGVQREFTASPLVSFSQLTAGSPFDAAWGRLVAADNGPHQTVYPEYHSAAAWLRPRARAGQSIALEEIGIISYYSGLQVIDTYGLADTTIAHRPGLPSDKVDIPYVLGRRPTYWAMPIHGDCLCITLSGDVAYSQTPTFSFGYDLAGVFPTDPKQVAVFRRRPGLVAVKSLDSELVDPIDFPAPTSLSVLPVGASVTTPYRTAARYALRGSIVGAAGTPEANGSTATLAVQVPRTGTTTFEIGTGPIGMTAPGTWTVRALPASGPSVTSQVTASVRTTSWQPMDLSVALSEWRGQRVTVSLTYHGGLSPGIATFVEPRLLQTAS